MTADDKTIKGLMAGSPITIDTGACYICHRTQVDIDNIIKQIKETETTRINELKRVMVNPESEGEYDDQRAKEALKQIYDLVNKKDIFLKTLMDQEMDYIVDNEKAIDEKIPGFLAITDFYKTVLDSKSYQTLGGVLRMLEHGDYRRELAEVKKRHDSKIKFYNDDVKKLDDYIKWLNPSSQFKNMKIEIPYLQRDSKFTPSSFDRRSHPFAIENDGASFILGEVTVMICPICSRILASMQNY